MRRAYCSSCARFEFRQAVERPVERIERPSLAEVLSIASVFGAYFFALAWAVSR